MRVVVVGGGMAGLVVARVLARHGMHPVLVERAAEGTPTPGPIMLPFQAYPALEDIGVLDAIAARARDIPPHRGDRPVAMSVARETVLGILREGLDIAWGQDVEDLVHTPPGRVVGVRIRGTEGGREVPGDLVVGADGARSRVRELAGISARTQTSDTAFVSFRSPVRSDEAFAIVFLSDGRQLTLLDWDGGTAGGWQIDRPAGGREEALAPGLDAYRRAFTRLMPQAGPALSALGSVDDLMYREVHEVLCDEWWRPGVALVGEALHAMNPEAGIGSGLGMGDAHALAVAIVRNPDDPDAACREYETWRRPAVEPYLAAMRAHEARVVRGGPLRDEERWPPSAPGRRAQP